MSTKLMEKTQAVADERPLAKHTVLLDDDKMVVTHWVFRPGEQTGWHKHELAYMPIPLSTGKLMFEYPDGTTSDLDYAPGKATMVSPPLEHNAINVGDTDIISLEIEFKKPQS